MLSSKCHLASRTCAGTTDIRPRGTGARFTSRSSLPHHGDRYSQHDTLLRADGIAASRTIGSTADGISSCAVWGRRIPTQGRAAATRLRGEHAWIMLPPTCSSVNNTWGGGGRVEKLGNSGQGGAGGVSSVSPGGTEEMGRWSPMPRSPLACVDAAACKDVPSLAIVRLDSCRLPRTARIARERRGRRRDTLLGEEEARRSHLASSRRSCHRRSLTSPPEAPVAEAPRSPVRESSRTVGLLQLPRRVPAFFRKRSMESEGYSTSSFVSLIAPSWVACHRARACLRFESW